MQTPDITEGNIEKIAGIFPNVVTEKESADGSVVKAVDFDLLRQALSKDLVEDENERYRLDWPGKKASLLKANTPIFKTLRPVREDSVDFDTTENLFIEGDNFEVLKILQESYLGKIKMIYIDPPYNTGKDFVYSDNFTVSKEEYEEEIGVEDEEGNKLFKENTRTNPRFHSDWCSMMYERLLISRDLLKDDGVIFVSIDDSEVHNLRKICDEIFGDENFITNFVWNSSTGGGIRSRFVNQSHQYILCYAKNITETEMFFASLSEDAKKQYKKEDKNGLYREKDFAWKNSSWGTNQKYFIECPDGEKVKPKDGYLFRFIRATFDEALSKDMVVFKSTKNGPLVNEKGEQANWNLYIKKYLGDGTGAPGSVIPKDLVGINNEGTTELNVLFDNNSYFESPKNVRLLKFLFSLLENESDDILLDFFSGSATTAHAVMELNAEDCGNRRFVLAQLPEETPVGSEAHKAGYKTIAEIGKERIRRAAKKIREEYKEKLAEHTTPLDTGFRVYKTDTTNMKDVFYHPAEVKQGSLLGMASNVKDDRTAEDLLTQVILGLGLELSLPIEKKEIRGQSVYFVAGNALVACFDDHINLDMIDDLAKISPLKVVFKDASFKNDSDRMNVETRMKRLSPETAITVL